MDKAKIKKIAKYLLIGSFIYAIGNLAAYVIGKHYGIGFIISPSLNKDFIVYTKNWKDKVSDGSIIYFKFPHDTPYYKKDMNFGKMVMCKEGETLEVKGLEYYCDGKYIGKALTHDKEGKPVKNFIFNGKIPDGNYFVMGTHQRSYDSRYWGFVPEEKIKGVAIWSI
ncbi:signal peptidase I [Nitrosophilus labii]|uniref:signal peptidase I n=1 Tax=Nitrosophilus labii TaxID=2706014 RepID=UPI00165748D4|nr:signal peptidase I [Nitrosophilus labii]